VWISSKKMEKQRMNGTIERSDKEKSKCRKTLTHTAEINPFFTGVLRRYQDDDVGKGQANSMNFALFTYAGQNPIIYLDPDGKMFGVDDVIEGEMVIGAADLIDVGICAALLPVATWYFKNEDQIKQSAQDMLKSISGPNAATPPNPQKPDDNNKDKKSENKLKPDSKAEGDHTTFKRNPQTGKIDKYETWKKQTNPKKPNPWESVKRYDGSGDPHFNKATQQDVDTPHIHDPNAPGEVRPANPNEIPRNKN